MCGFFLFCFFLGGGRGESVRMVIYFKILSGLFYLNIDSVEI